MGANTSKIEYTNLEFHDKIGEGGFGFVHRVSFKKPYRGYTEAAAKTVFVVQEEEVVIMSKLHHPNIIELIGFSETGHVNTGIILMEYAKRGSLHDYLEDPAKPLPYPLKIKWVQESAHAIEYLHEQNFLHRDLKANNCLLFEDNVLKLCDFGLAREMQHSQTTSSIKGTYRYMAPEILKGNDQGRAEFSKPADIYGYGMLVLEICSRKPPFDDLEWQQVVLEVGANGKQPDIPADCPSHLADIMRRCWHTDPKKRPKIEHILEGYSKFMKVTEILPEHDGTPLTATAVASCPNGDMAVIGGCMGKLYILGSDGQYKRELEADHDKVINYACDITVSHQSHVMTVDMTRFVKVFSISGQYLHCFGTINRDEDPNTNIHLNCITTDREGHVLVNDCTRRVITIHTCPDGSLVDKIKYKVLVSNNACMAVNSKKQILIHSNRFGSSSKVSAIDYSGKEVFTFTPKEDVYLTHGLVSSCGIACDPTDNIYIAVRVRGEHQSGQIHQYSPDGTYMRCIATGLQGPFDLSIAYGSLLVANKISILVYHLPMV